MKIPAIFQRCHRFRLSLSSIRVLSPGGIFLALCAAALFSIAIAAIIFTSVTRQRPLLDNGSVWVASQNDGKIARVNPALHQIDATLSATGSDFDVLQSADSTLLTTGTTLHGIDAATLGTGQSVTIPSTTSAFMGAETVALFDHASGEVRLTHASAETDSLGNALTRILAEPAALTLPHGSQIALTADGTTYAYRASDGMALRFSSTPSAQSRPEQLGSLTDGHAVEAQGMTIIDKTPVILTGTSVRWPGKIAHVPSDSHLLLQSTPTEGASGNVQRNTVVVASDEGVSVISLASGKITSLHSGVTALPATPVSANGCVHAGWSAPTHNYWMMCEGRKTPTPPEFRTLTGISSTAHLIFRTNHRSVILNNIVDGSVWNPNDSDDAIALSWKTSSPAVHSRKDSAQESARTHENFSRSCSTKNDQISAHDDSFGIRPGNEQLLDVLRNDHQTSCSVLRIDTVQSVDSSQGRLSIISDGRYLKFAAAPKAHGALTVAYSITDGRGAPSSALLRITVVPPRVRHAPRQNDIPPVTDVERDASVEINALESFSDPDGDPLALVSAHVENSTHVSVVTRADGFLSFAASSAPPGRVSVSIRVSDGTDVTSGVVYFSVKPSESLAPLTDPLLRTLAPGAVTTISLAHAVHSSSATMPHLTTVDSDASSTVSDVTRSNDDDPTLSFSSSVPGTHYVTYSVEQNGNSSLGLVRVEVQAIPSHTSVPITKGDTALLNASGTAILDPLINDVDPLGGVLALAGASVSSSAAQSTGLRVSVVDHRRLYITVAHMPKTTQRITYVAANAHARSTGIITVMPHVSPATSTVHTRTLEANVRQRGIVTIPVVERLSENGMNLSLKPKLATNPATFKGMAFVSGDSVRYQAASAQGRFPITYTVSNDTGATASGTILITVHSKEASTKQKPRPRAVEAQTVAGHTVKIPINLSGIDNDGDDVALLGQAVPSPTKGRITKVGADYVEYEAYSDASGTDTFRYAVEDWSGQRVTASIRVGILDASTPVTGVTARDDTIQLRPGSTANVAVLRNDLCDENDTLTLSPHVEAHGISTVSVGRSTLRFTAPQRSGTSIISYTALTPSGLSDSATLTVIVSRSAALLPPTAADTAVSPEQSVNRRSVNVDVTTFISNPSGALDDLAVAVHPSAKDHAYVTAKKSTVITVELTEEARAVPYTVTNTRYHLTSIAFIQVPAYGVFPPLLRPKTPKLSVLAGSSLIIRLADYVRVGAGKSPFIRSSGDVSATRSDGSSLLINHTTLKFRSSKDYSGPASISFTVFDTDAASAHANSSTLTLPITVRGRHSSPPLFSPLALTLGAGDGAHVLSLASLITSPAGTGKAKTSYLYSFASKNVTSEAQSRGFEITLARNGIFHAAARATAAPGAMMTIPLLVTYDGIHTIRGDILLTATITTRPLAHIPNADVTAIAGTPTRLALLTNVYNPFPNTPLKLTGAAGTAPGVRVTWTPTGIITISVKKGFGGGTVSVLATISDATKLASRTVNATISVSVRDLPEAPRLDVPRNDAIGNRHVTLSWTTNSNGGISISEYQVTWKSDHSSGSQTCGTSAVCAIANLRNGISYSFRVRARNAVGWSPLSSPVTATPDTPPSSPLPHLTAVGIGTLRIEWKEPLSPGSPITSYKIQARCAELTREITVGKVHSTTLNDLPPSPCSVSIYAKNGAGWSTETHTATLTPLGTPDAPHITISNTKNGVVTGTATVNPHGQRLAEWHCTAAGNPCSIHSDNTTESVATAIFSISVAPSTWYAGNTVPVTVTSSFDHARSTVSPQLDVAMTPLDIGPITLQSVRRNSATGRLHYSYAVHNGTNPAIATLASSDVATLLHLQGCACTQQRYSPGVTVSEHVNATCTGVTATIDLIVFGHVMTTSVPFTVEEETDADASSGNATTTAALILPGHYSPWEVTPSWRQPPSTMSHN